jgi:hypothetical protein
MRLTGRVQRKLYLEQKDDYANRLHSVEDALRAALGNRDFAQLQALNNLRTTYETELLKLKDPIVISPFYQNRSIFYFLIAHLALGLVIILARGDDSFSPRLKLLLPLGIILYVLFMSTNWLRNFLFYDEGRTIFSFVNFDLSPLSFFIQEFQAFVLSVMIAYYWMQLSHIHKTSFDETTKWHAGSFSHEEDSETLRIAGSASNFINKLIFRWQVSSVLIVCAFLPWTLFYWVNSVTYADSRYLISAVIFHMYWLITWVLCSVPLVWCFQRWLEFKTDLLVCYASGKEEEAGVKNASEVLSEMTPLSVWQMSAAGILRATGRKSGKFAGLRIGW